MRTFKMFLSILAGVALLILMIDCLELLQRGFIERLGGGGALVWMSARRTFVLIQTVMPFIMLLTAIFTLLALNRSRELVILRASGLSVWQFLQPIGFVAIICGIFAALVINPLAAIADETVDRDKVQSSTQTNVTTVSEFTQWIRQGSGDGAILIGFKAQSNKGQFLSDVTLFALDEEGQQTALVSAAFARLVENEWLLTNATITRDGQAKETVSEFKVQTNVDARQLEFQSKDAEMTSIYELPNAARQAKAAGLSEAPYVQALHANLAKPLFFLSMVTLASILCLRFGRFGRYDGMVLGGMISGFLLYIFVEIFDGLGASGALPPYAAVWVPLVLVILVAATVLLHQEDG